MYEYKVDIYKVKYAEDAMNAYAKEGWRVIAVTPDHQSGFVDVFFERRKADGVSEPVEDPAPDPTDIVSGTAELSDEGSVGNADSIETESENNESEGEE